MRVLLVDPSARGGIATYTAQLAAALAAAGAAPTVLASRGLPAGAATAASPVLRLLPDHAWGRPQSGLAAFYAQRALEVGAAARALLWTVRRLRPDVVHLQFGLSPQADATLVRLVRRTCPVVWTAHDVDPLEGDDGQRHLAALRVADRVIVHTAPAQAHLAALGIASDVVEHVPTTLPEAARCTPQQARARLGLAADGRVLAALGYVRPYKGYDLLAQVWEELGPAAPRLLVLGAPWSDADAAVLDRLEATGSADVRRGYASDVDLALAARAADAVLLPHVRASDSGLLHLARAAGTPVLASDAPQLAASVLGSGAGAVVPRTAGAWAQAVTGALPVAPPPPPALSATGRRHLEVYAAARGDRQPPRGRLLAVTDATALGGAETVLAHVVRALSVDHDVTVAACDPTVLAHVLAQAGSATPLLVPPVADKRDLLPVLAQTRAFRAARPDVVLVNLRTPWAAQYSTVAALTLGVPVIAVEHSTVPPTAAFQLRAKRWTAARLAAHVTVTAASARYLEQLIGLPPGHVRVIPNGVSRRTVVPVEPPAGLPRPLIVAAGRLDLAKGFDVLLDALVLLPGVSLWLLGDGEQAAALRTQVERLELGDRVLLSGWHPDPAAAFAIADVVVISSREDALPLTTFEALQVGAALVATRVGGLAEAIGDAGLLVAPDDAPALAHAVRAVLDDPTLARELRRRGTERAALAPTIEQTGVAYQGLVEDVLRAGRRRRRRRR